MCGGGGPKYKGDDLVPEMIQSREPTQLMTHGDKRPRLNLIARFLRMH